MRLQSSIFMFLLASGLSGCGPFIPLDRSAPARLRMPPSHVNEERKAVDGGRLTVGRKQANGNGIPADKANDKKSGDSVKPQEPVIKQGLLIKVTVFAGGKKEVDEPFKRVSVGGIITLPLVGYIKVEGLTLRDLSAMLKTQYSAYLRDPSIDVDFVLETGDSAISPWGYITVLGRVKKPGRVNIPPTQDLTLSMAVQFAGGLDTSAKIYGIKISREKNGQTEQIEVDLQSVGSKGEVDSDIKLYPGDVVYVPERVF